MTMWQWEKYILLAMNLMRWLIAIILRFCANLQKKLIQSIKHISYYVNIQIINFFLF